MKRLKTTLRTLYWHWWLPPSLVALASLAGIVSIVVDPWCYLSRSMACYEFALDNAWGSWRHGGKWDGLQFFGAAFLGATALFSWPLLRAQTVRYHGKRLAVALEFCFTLGYLVLLYGIASSIYQENSMLAKIYVGITVLVPVTIIICMIFFHLIYVVIRNHVATATWLRYNGVARAYKRFAAIATGWRVWCHAAKVSITRWIDPGHPTRRKATMSRFMKTLRTPFVSTWTPPTLAAIASLAGLVLIVVDPWCHLSGCMESCEFALGNAWKHYDGKWEGLQFFGTGFLGAAATFSWPALRDQIVCRYGSRCGARLVVTLNICFRLGYFALLSGIAGDTYQENQNLTEGLAIYISAPLVALMTIVGWVIIIRVICIAVMCAKRKMLLPLRCRVLRVWRTFALHLQRKNCP